MSTSASLQPGITTSDLGNTLSSATSVTNYAQASITAIPTLQSTDSWIIPIQNDINTAQANAQNWLSNLCPSISVGVAKSIIDYNNTFQAATNQILAELQGITTTPTQQQIDAINNQFAVIDAKIGALQTSAKILLAGIATFAGKLNTDQNTLSNDLNIAATKYLNGAKAVREISTIIGTNFLNSSVLGPCNCIVMVNTDIEIKVAETGADPDLITIIYIQAIIETLVGNLQAAQTPAQLVLDSWTILNLQMTTLINDLSATSADDYTSFIDQLQLETAQQDWQVLANFAETLINNL